MMNCFTLLFLRLAQWKGNLKVAQTKVSPDSSPKVTPDGQLGGGNGAMRSVEQAVKKWLEPP
jgi:hypothetical protein